VPDALVANGFAAASDRISTITTDRAGPVMSLKTILEWIRRMFASDPSEHLDSISEAFLKRTLNQPAHPMSDGELARAIREFHALPGSDCSVAKLSRHVVKVPRDG
jgi:hypothetical protein